MVVFSQLRPQIFLSLYQADKSRTRGAHGCLDFANSFLVLDGMQLEASEEKPASHIVGVAANYIYI